jgi:hypothetical protein
MPKLRFNDRSHELRIGFGRANGGVTAFQRHFRPGRVDGVADHSTLTTLQALLASLPAEAMAVAAK